MANTIKIKRGLSSNISNATLEQGELAITTDTNELYIGTKSGNIKLNESNIKTLMDIKNKSLSSTKDDTELSFLRGMWGDEGQHSVTLNSAWSPGDMAFSANSGVAHGDYSVALNAECHTYGTNSLANGLWTRAGSADQHVEGRCNIIDNANKYAYIIGNGHLTDDVSSPYYSNAHTLDWNGNAWF